MRSGITLQPDMVLEQGSYQIQQLDLRQVAQTFGTPLYVYDAEKIVKQIQQLKAAFPGVKLKLKYAAKALTNLSILQLMRKHGVQLDTVSMGETHLGLRAGYLPEEIMLTLNFAPFAEVEEAVAAGVMVNVDNLAVLEAFGARYGSSVPCCIRINPNFRAGGNAKIQVGHDKSKFGIPHTQIDDVLEIVEKYGIRIAGLHKHTGSDIREAEAFTQGASLLFSLAMRFPDLQFIDLGGGFKVPYKAGDPVLDMRGLGSKVVDAFQTFCRAYGREIELWFEPGKYLVSEAGLLLASVTSLKHNAEISFVGLDTGLNHLVRPMMYNAWHDIVNLSNPMGVRKTYDVVGYICETDTFAPARELPEVRQGDILAIKNAGAYGFSMSSQYNTRPRPAEVLIHEGSAHLIRQRETLEDLMRHQIGIFD